MARHINLVSRLIINLPANESIHEILFLSPTITNMATTFLGHQAINIESH